MTNNLVLFFKTLVKHDHVLQIAAYPDEVFKKIILIRELYYFPVLQISDDIRK